MEYRLVKHKVSAVLSKNVEKLADEFTRQVNEHIRSGWEPVGGVAIGQAGSTTYLIQALIKRR